MLEVESHHRRAKSHSEVWESILICIAIVISEARASSRGNQLLETGWISFSDSVSKCTSVMGRVFSDS